MYYSESTAASGGGDDARKQDKDRIEEGHTVPKRQRNQSAEIPGSPETEEDEDETEEQPNRYKWLQKSTKSRSEDRPAHADEGEDIYRR